MNNYQAVYDAVLQAFDISHARDLLQQEFLIAAAEMQRPSVLYRPALSLDGTKWCALYGRDLMDGVAGFGDTPAEAMAEFDREWREQRTPAAIRATAAKP